MFGSASFLGVFELAPSKNNKLASTLTEGAEGQGSVRVLDANSDLFQERMKSLVHQFGSIAEIARKCGFPESTVKKWVDGISDPSRERCIALANGTGISLLWLMAGEGPMLAADLAAPRQSQDLRPDNDTLRAAIDAVESAIEAMGYEVTSSGRAKVIGLVYEHLIAERSAAANVAHIIRLIREAANAGE